MPQCVVLRLEILQRLSTAMEANCFECTFSGSTVGKSRMQVARAWRSSWLAGACSLAQWWSKTFALEAASRKLSIESMRMGGVKAPRRHAATPPVFHSAACELWAISCRHVAGVVRSKLRRPRLGPGVVVSTGALWCPKTREAPRK